MYDCMYDTIVLEAPSIVVYWFIGLYSGTSGHSEIRKHLYSQDNFWSPKSSHLFIQASPNSVHNRGEVPILEERFLY